MKQDLIIQNSHLLKTLIQCDPVSIYTHCLLWTVLKMSERMFVTSETVVSVRQKQHFMLLLILLQRAKKNFIGRFSAKHLYRHMFLVLHTVTHSLIIAERSLSMSLFCPAGGSSVPAVERSVSRPLPPSPCSRLGRRCRQQSQLWHGYRSVGVCAVCVLPCLLYAMILSFTHCLSVYLHPPPQGKQEGSSNQATWWLWWQAGSQGPVILTLWGPSMSRNKQISLDPSGIWLTCWADPSDPL